MVVVAAGDGRAADEHDADLRVFGALAGQPRQPVVVPAQVGHAPEPSQSREEPGSEGQHVSVTMGVCGALCFFDSRADVPSSRGHPSLRGVFSCPEQAGRDRRDKTMSQDQAESPDAGDQGDQHVEQTYDIEAVQEKWLRRLGGAAAVPGRRRQPAREALRADDVPLPLGRPAHGSRRGVLAARRDRPLLVAAWLRGPEPDGLRLVRPARRERRDPEQRASGARTPTPTSPSRSTPASG